MQPFGGHHVPKNRCNSDTVFPIDSAARNGESVARRRFQKGSVYLNKTRTMWLGMFSQYVLDSHGVERRARKQVVLGPVRKPDCKDMTKREACRLLQPYVDRVNASIAAPAKEAKNITTGAFATIWERDCLSLSKPSTQSAMRAYLKRIKQAFGGQDMRLVGAGDLQSLVAQMKGEGYAPKTIRNLWTTVRLIWDVALSQGYVDRLLAKPKLPRLAKKQPRYFKLDEVARVIATSEGEQRVFYWLLAESGVRAGEIAGWRLEDVQADRIVVNQSVWNGQVQTPKSENAIRSIAISRQLGELLQEQVERQRSRRHAYLFSSANGTPWDMNVFRKRKMRETLKTLGIPQAGFHGFRHFNVSLLDSLRVPLKVIQERIGHALTGSFTLDVYGHSDWGGNKAAAQQAGDAIAGAVESAKAENSVNLTSIQGCSLMGQNVVEAVA
jgi:integrase